MNTLHHCRWQGQEHLQNHLPLFNQTDGLILLGVWPLEALQQLHTKLGASVNRCHLVNSEPNPYIQTIDHNTWLGLITKHRNTHAWK